MIKHCPAMPGCLPGWGTSDSRYAMDGAPNWLPTERDQGQREAAAARGRLPQTARMTERKTSDARLRPRGEFASILLGLRREFGLSQRQMAALAGMTQSEIARLERGTVSPTWQTGM